jgi:hypothetical protein
MNFIIEKPEYSGNKSGYNLLTEEEKEKIVFLSDTNILPTAFDSTKYYAVLPEHLKNYMSNFDSCIIYFWEQECKGDLCFSPSVYQQFCNKYNYKFIFIPQGYYYIRYIDKHNKGIDYPFFCVNSFYYKTDLKNNYIKRFKKSLFDRQYKELKKNIWSRLWVYKNGNFYNASPLLNINELKEIENEKIKMKSYFNLY